MMTWILNLFATVLIITVITLLLPEGRLSKFAKPFISLVLILVIISPITDLSGVFSGEADKGVSIETDQDFLFKTATAKIGKIRDNCVKIAEKSGINGAEFLIEYTVSDDYSPVIYGVEINLTNAVITSENEHIVIVENLKEDIKKYLSLSDEGVKIVE